MGWFDEPKTNKGATFNLMTAMGIKRAVVSFSGGNDEGGVDEITAYNADGGEIGFGSTDRWGQLEELLGRPVYDQYSSFAGEFYVDGEVTWDLSDRTVKMKGNERVDAYEGFDREL